MTVKGGREAKREKRRKEVGREGGCVSVCVCTGGGVFVSLERDGGGKTEPDVQETEGKTW